RPAAIALWVHRTAEADLVPFHHGRTVVEVLSATGLRDEVAVVVDGLERPRSLVGVGPTVLLDAHARRFCVLGQDGCRTGAKRKCGRNIEYRTHWLCPYCKENGGAALPKTRPSSTSLGVT